MAARRSNQFPLDSRAGNRIYRKRALAIGWEHDRLPGRAARSLCQIIFLLSIIVFFLLLYFFFFFVKPLLAREEYEC